MRGSIACCVQRVFVVSVLTSTWAGCAYDPPEDPAAASDEALLTIQVCGPFVDGVPNVGMGADGNYGDGKKGPLAAAEDATGLTVDPNRANTLALVESGALTPDPDTRLGAYASTRGFEQGSAGYAVHQAIGSLYESLGTYGEEKIGRVFLDPAITVFYEDPVDSPSGRRLADIEYRYWQNVACEDLYSSGGKLGSAFSPSVRDWLQTYYFSN